MLAGQYRQYRVTDKTDQDCVLDQLRRNMEPAKTTVNTAGLHRKTGIKEDLEKRSAERNVDDTFQEQLEKDVDRSTRQN